MPFFAAIVMEGERTKVGFQTYIFEDE